MRICQLYLFLFSTILLSFPAHAERLMIATEEYAPLSYTENGEIKGVATEQVKLIFDKAGVDYEMNVFPWARAYNNAVADDNTCVFTTSNTLARRDKFKWVEPLSLNKSVLVKLEGSDVKVGSLEEAKKFNIGIQNEDAGGEKLKELGFDNLSVGRSADQTLKKLKGGRVDMMVMAESRFKEMASGGEPLAYVADIFSLKMGLACNPSVSDQTIAALQQQLDTIIENGTQAKIAKKYE
jgi:polar amino acid transport system substrate-binding protein